MKFDSESYFTYTVLRNGVFVEDEGWVWDFNDGLMEPTLDDIIDNLKKNVESKGEKLMVFSYGDSSIFFSLNITV